MREIKLNLENKNEECDITPVAGMMVDCCLYSNPILVVSTHGLGAAARELLGDFITVNMRTMDVNDDMSSGALVCLKSVNAATVIGKLAL